MFLHVLKASASNGSKNKKWYFFGRKLWPPPPKSTTFFFTPPLTQLIEQDVLCTDTQTRSMFTVPEIAVQRRIHGGATVTAQLRVSRHGRRLLATAPVDRPAGRCLSRLDAPGGGSRLLTAAGHGVC